GRKPREASKFLNSVKGLSHPTKPFFLLQIFIRRREFQYEWSATQ
ncbi:MAG: hypothetical protein RIS43_683, partial [Actinomycetota bacterium]